MSYEAVLADASPEVRAFADRIQGWITAAGWSTRTTPSSLQLLTQDEAYVCMFYPGTGRMEVDLRRFRRRGLDDVADDLADRLSSFAGEDLTRRSVQVPVAAITERWDEFFEVFLPRYVSAVAEADLSGPDPGPGGA